MKLYFTGDGRQSFNRIRDLWGALVRNGHRVRKTRAPVPAPDTCDVWFHDVEVQFPFSAELEQPMLAFGGDLVFYRTDDTLDFPHHKIPDSLLQRARLFLASHWSSDPSATPAAILERSGLVNPLLVPMRPRAGKPLRERRPCAFFYGARTGYDHLRGGFNPREETVRLLRAADTPFDGGLVHGGEQLRNPKELLVPTLSRPEYFRRLGESAICVCPWGNAALTYRLFEGLACRNLALVQSLAELRFADGGLTAGVHYVEVGADRSDLVEKVHYLLAHLGEAQRIADAGHELFKSHFAFSGLDLPQPLFEEITATWAGLLRPVRRRTARTCVLGWALPFLRKLPNS